MFSTGTDEHGLKIEQVANAQGKDPMSLCSEVASKFKVHDCVCAYLAQPSCFECFSPQELFDKAEISYTHFIRTTDPSHVKKVEEVWVRVVNQYSMHL